MKNTVTASIDLHLKMADQTHAGAHEKSWNHKSSSDTIPGNKKSLERSYYNTMGQLDIEGAYIHLLILIENISSNFAYIMNRLRKIILNNFHFGSYS